MFKQLLAATTIALSSFSYAHADGHALDWSGFFIGGAVSYVDADAEIHEGPIAGPPSINFVAGTGLVSDHDSLTGVMGGIHGGYRFQRDNLVLGLEASYSAANSASDDAPFGAGPPFVNSLEIESLLQVGGQIGLARDQYLFYVSGGYARAEANLEIFGFGGSLGSADSDFDGYYIGGGIERELDNNWSFGVEYNYLSFDDDSDNVPITGFGPGAFVDYTVKDFSANVFKFKITKRFN